MKFLIVGAGWYGCHIACELLNKNQEVIIVDKQNCIFGGSSHFNQNRLHLGFHYPRSEKTIEECLKGFDFFSSEKYYHHILEDIENNLYFVAKGSKVSFQEYCEVFKKEKFSNHLNFENFEDNDYWKTKYIFGESLDKNFLNVKEKFINYKKAKSHFEKYLSDFFLKIDDEDVFKSIEKIKKHVKTNEEDCVINCTFNQLDPFEFSHYELFVSLVYKKKNGNAVNECFTIMDGNYFSIYKYDENRVTVTSVEFGPFYSGKCFFENNSEKYNQIINKQSISDLILRTERGILNFFPFFLEEYEYDSFFTSWKTKPTDSYDSDDRSVRIKKDKKYFSIYGGKITGIFSAWKQIEEEIFLS